jgi:hypothetical protein
MTARALAAIPFIVSFAVLIGLAFIRRDRLRNRLNDTRDEHAQGHGVGGADIFQHGGAE